MTITDKEMEIELSEDKRGNKLTYEYTKLMKSIDS